MEVDSIVPIGLFSAVVAGGSAVLFSAESNDAVGILNEGRVTMRPMNSVSLERLALSGLTKIGIV